MMNKLDRAAMGVDKRSNMSTGLQRSKRKEMLHEKENNSGILIFTSHVNSFI